MVRSALNRYDLSVTWKGSKEAPCGVIRLDGPCSSTLAAFPSPHRVLDQNPFSSATSTDHTPADRADDVPRCESSKGSGQWIISAIHHGIVKTSEATGCFSLELRRKEDLDGP